MAVQTTTAAKGTREEWLNHAVKLMRPHFEKVGHPIPAKVRVSCSFPSHKAVPRKPGANSHAIGQCWDKEASMDGHFELFMSPLVDNSGEVLAILAHELVHAAVGTKAGHKAPFKKAALAIGLEGKMTATTAGPGFIEWTQPLLTKLNGYPHARVKPSWRPTKKQPTRMLKLECEECGYIIRTTQKWLDTGVPTCHCGGSFPYEGEEEGEGEE